MRNHDAYLRSDSIEAENSGSLSELGAQQNAKNLRIIKRKQSSAELIPQTAEVTTVEQPGAATEQPSLPQRSDSADLVLSAPKHVSEQRNFQDAEHVEEVTENALQPLEGNSSSMRLSESGNGVKPIAGEQVPRSHTSSSPIDVSSSSYAAAWGLMERLSRLHQQSVGSSPIVSSQALSSAGGSCEDRMIDQANVKAADKFSAVANLIEDGMMLKSGPFEKLLTTRSEAGANANPLASNSSLLADAFAAGLDAAVNSTYYDGNSFAEMMAKGQRSGTNEKLSSRASLGSIFDGSRRVEANALQENYGAGRGLSLFSHLSGEIGSGSAQMGQISAAGGPPYTSAGAPASMAPSYNSPFPPLHPGGGGGNAAGMQRSAAVSSRSMNVKDSNTFAGGSTGGGASTNDEHSGSIPSSGFTASGGTPSSGLSNRTIQMKSEIQPATAHSLFSEDYMMMESAPNIIGGASLFGSEKAIIGRAQLQHTQPPLMRRAFSINPYLIDTLLSSQVTPSGGAPLITGGGNSRLSSVNHPLVENLTSGPPTGNYFELDEEGEMLRRRHAAKMAKAKAGEFSSCHSSPLLSSSPRSKHEATEFKNPDLLTLIGQQQQQMRLQQAAASTAGSAAASSKCVSFGNKAAAAADAQDDWAPNTQIAARRLVEKLHRDSLHTENPMGRVVDVLKAAIALVERIGGDPIKFTQDQATGGGLRSGISAHEAPQSTSWWQQADTMRSAEVMLDFLASGQQPLEDRILHGSSQVALDHPTTNSRRLYPTGSASAGTAPGAAVTGPSAKTVTSAWKGLAPATMGVTPSATLNGGGDGESEVTALNNLGLNGLLPPTTGNTAKMLHPDEFRNPSTFLKMYGDPLCFAAGGPLPKRGKNGNWECVQCGNVNFPRRFRCNKCTAPRDEEGDKVVARYVRTVHEKYQVLPTTAPGFYVANTSGAVAFSNPTDNLPVGVAGLKNLMKQSIRPTDPSRYRAQQHPATNHVERSPWLMPHDAVPHEQPLELHPSASPHLRTLDGNSVPAGNPSSLFTSLNPGAVMVPSSPTRRPPSPVSAEKSLSTQRDTDQVAAAAAAASLQQMLLEVSLASAGGTTTGGCKMMGADQMNPETRHSKRRGSAGNSAYKEDRSPPYWLTPSLLMASASPLDVGGAATGTPADVTPGATSESDTSRRNMVRNRFSVPPPAVVDPTIFIPQPSRRPSIASPRSNTPLLPAARNSPALYSRKGSRQLDEADEMAPSKLEPSSIANRFAGKQSSRSAIQQKKPSVRYSNRPQRQQIWIPKKVTQPI